MSRARQRMQFGNPPQTNRLWNVASRSSIEGADWPSNRTAEPGASVENGQELYGRGLRAASGGNFYVPEIGDVRTPTLQSVFALRQELMPLIDRGYAGDRPRLVIEHLVGDMRGDPKPSHT